MTATASNSPTTDQAGGVWFDIGDKVTLTNYPGAVFTVVSEICEESATGVVIRYRVVGHQHGTRYEHEACPSELEPVPEPAPDTVAVDESAGEPLFNRITERYCAADTL